MSYACTAPGLYRDSRTGNFVERPWINGKRTWRKLKSRTLKDAKRELAARQTDHVRSTFGLAKDPYAPPSKTIGDICADYQDAGCPDRQHSPKTGKALAQEVYRLQTLFPFWSKRLVDSVKAVDCALYFAWRKKRLKRGAAGGRTTDMELGTLNNALSWAASVGKIHANPLATGRPRFRVGKNVKHCRDFMPADGNELHDLARKLFSVRQSEVLGWQLLIEAMTGCRTSEVLRLRWDASHISEAGYLDAGCLWVSRSKGGVNPFITVHTGLSEAILALKAWHLWRFPKSKWWFPDRAKAGSRKDEAVRAQSLTRALRRISKVRRTSHGLRAYYVTVRRSQGVSDAQIAAEIGDKSGAAIIVSTYGAVPPNWRGSDALSWLPTKGKPAWVVLKMPENIVSVVFPAVASSNRKS